MEEIMKLLITYDTDQTLEYNITKNEVQKLTTFLKDMCRGTMVLYLSEHGCSIYLNKHRTRNVVIVWVEEIEIAGL